MASTYYCFTNSSSYYKFLMNNLNQQIRNKEKRKSTCESVKRNLDNLTNYSSIANDFSEAASQLEEGLYGMNRTLSVPDDLRRDREQPPYGDDQLSNAMYSLQREISKLAREIDRLQQQYNDASRNYRAAKEREWKETLEGLNLR